MDEKTETHLSRPKLLNVPLPVPVLVCLFCGKRMTKKGEESHSIASAGVVVFACSEHRAAAAQMVQYTKDYIDRRIKAAMEEESEEPTQGQHSERCAKHKQKCPKCENLLYCLECRIGGGSHYWLLRCHTCKTFFDYDTYRFQLEKADWINT